MILAPRTAAVMEQTLLLLALRGQYLLLVLPLQVLALGLHLKLSHIQLALKLLHAENLITPHPVFRENQHQLTALAPTVHLYIQDILVAPLQRQHPQVLFSPPLHKVTSANVT